MARKDPAACHPVFAWSGAEALYGFQSAEYAATIPLHRHEYYEMFLVLDGRIAHLINGQSRLLEAGTLVLIRPNDVHCLRPHESRNAHFINLEFSKRSIEALFDFLGPAYPAGSLTEADMPPERLLDLVEKREIESRLNALNTLPRGDAPPIQLALRMLLFELCVRFFPPESFNRPSRHPQWLERTCAEVRKPDNLAAGLDRLIEISGRSHECVCRAFRKHLDQTPSEYLNDVRLNYAANLLLHTTRSVAEIAYTSGYGNLGYFYRLFKQRYDATPQGFRSRGHTASSARESSSPVG